MIARSASLSTAVGGTSDVAPAEPAAPALFESPPAAPPAVVPAPPALEAAPALPFGVVLVPPVPEPAFEVASEAVVSVGGGFVGIPEGGETLFGVVAFGGVPFGVAAGAGTTTSSVLLAEGTPIEGTLPPPLSEVGPTTTGLLGTPEPTLVEPSLRSSSAPPVQASRMNPGANQTPHRAMVREQV